MTVPTTTPRLIRRTPASRWQQQVPAAELPNILTSNGTAIPRPELIPTAQSMQRTRTSAVPQWHRRWRQNTHPPAVGRPSRPGKKTHSRPPSASRITRHRGQRISTTNAPDWSQEWDVGVQRTSSRGLTPARDAAQLLVRALLEVLLQRRPARQISAHCAPNVFHGLPFATLGDSRSSLHLMTVWVCEPADGVAEVSVVFQTDGRTRALALQLTSLDHRWRITELTIG